MNGLRNALLLLVGAVALATPVRADGPMSPLRPIATHDPGAHDAAGTSPPAAEKQGAPSPSTGGDAAPVAASGTAAAAVPPRNTGTGAGAAGGVKPGRWQFTTRLLAPEARKQDTGSDIATTYTNCLASNNAVPVAFGAQCTLDSREREGATVTWSMNCAGTQVHSQGAAQYAGDTMEATVVSQLHGADGKTTTMTQRITGRYLGTCAATPEPPPGETAAKATAAAVQPSPPTQEKAEAAPPAYAAVQMSRRRYAGRSSRHYSRYGGGRNAWGSGSSDRGAYPVGPSPFSSYGP